MKEQYKLSEEEGDKKTEKLKELEEQYEKTTTVKDVINELQKFPDNLEIRVGLLKIKQIRKGVYGSGTINNMTKHEFISIDLWRNEDFEEEEFENEITNIYNDHFPKPVDELTKKEFEEEKQWIKSREKVNQDIEENAIKKGLQNEITKIKCEKEAIDRRKKEHNTFYIDDGELTHPGRD